MGMPGYKQCVGLDFVNGMCEAISLISYNNDPSIYHNICIDSVSREDFAGLRFNFDIRNIEKTIQINSPSTIRLISTTGESVEIPFMVKPAYEDALLSKLPIGEINLMILEFNKPISRFTPGLAYVSDVIRTAGGGRARGEGAPLVAYPDKHLRGSLPCVGLHHAHST